MGEGQGEGRSASAAEELILRTIAAHANSLLRTARRHSICVDDAQDAYQRALEIFMAHAGRLDAARAPGWLHVVVKREAQAIRKSRCKLVGSADVDLDAHQAPGLPTPEEQLLSFDLVSRSAEALQRLKPQELRALWLKAQGHSYNEIGAITGWSYTKVNRCLTEGRRSFLARYAGIESGAECERWAPVISAMADGEATPAQILELRPHLRNCPRCRATLKALQESADPLAAVLPIPLLAVSTGAHEHLSNLAMRAYEAIAGGLHERAVTSITKAQAAMEAAAAGKVAAVAASAAAVAGGGYATVERTVRDVSPRAVVKREAGKKRPVRAGARLGPAGSKLRPTAQPGGSPAPVPNGRSEFAAVADERHNGSAPEFQPRPRRLRVISARAASVDKSRSTPSPTTKRAPAPEFRDPPSNPAPEFGP